MHLKLFMVFLILSGMFHHANALITSDVIPTQILKVYDQNILAINRGLEDGMFKGSHVKLTSDDGFIARGISLKSSMTVSYVKIYRVVRPELVNKDTLYSLKDMHQSEIPEDLKYLKNAGLPFNLKEIKPSELGKQLKLQQKRIAKFDLPESIKKAEKKKPSEAENFLKKNLSFEQLKADISKLDINIMVSPYQTQTLTEQKNISYGIGINNFGSKYDFSFKYLVSETTLDDPYTEKQFSSRREFGVITFDVNKISENVSYFVYGSRESMRNGEFYNPKERLSAGLTGFKYHFVDDELETLKTTGFYKVDLSYVPLYEIYSWEFENNGKKTDTDRYLRHAFRLRSFAKISSNSSLKVQAWWRPYQNINSGSFDWENNLTDLNLTLTTEVINSLSLDMSVNYTYDILQQRNYGVDPQNVTNTVSLNYKLPLRF